MRASTAPRLDAGCAAAGGLPPLAALPQANSASAAAAPAKWAVRNGGRMGGHRAVRASQAGRKRLAAPLHRGIRRMGYSGPGVHLDFRILGPLEVRADGTPWH